MRRSLPLLLAGAAALALLAGISAAAYHFGRNIETLRLAVAPESPFDIKIAEKIEALMRARLGILRIAIVRADNEADVLARLKNGQTDLALIRLQPDLPSNIQAVAAVSKTVLVPLLNGKAGDALEKLKGKRVVVVSDDPRAETTAARILEFYRPGHKPQILRVPEQTSLESLGTLDAALVFASPAALDGGRTHVPKGMKLVDLSATGVLTKHYPSLEEHKIETGVISRSPKLPDDDIDTVALTTQLVARSGLRASAVTPVAQVLIEHGRDVAAVSGSTRVQMPDPDEPGYLPIHPGARQAKSGETSSLFDRANELFFLVTSIGGLIGSVFLAVWARFTRVERRPASDTLPEILRVREAIREADGERELEIAETKLDDLLTQTLRGLTNRTVSPRGLDAFRLSYEHARAAISRKRETVAERPAANQQDRPKLMQPVELNPR